MSFSANVKSELCRPEVEKGCCALAEAMGALLYANTFSADGIRIVTESRDLGLRLPRLFRKGLGVSAEKHVYVLRKTPPITPSCWGMIKTSLPPTSRQTG